MSVRCRQCGEQLMGKVNRCWKCGAAVITVPSQPSSSDQNTSAAEPIRDIVPDDGTPKQLDLESPANESFLEASIFDERRLQNDEIPLAQLVHEEDFPNPKTKRRNPSSNPFRGTRMPKYPVDALQNSLFIGALIAALVGLSSSVFTPWAIIPTLLAGVLVFHGVKQSKIWKALQKPTGLLAVILLFFAFVGSCIRTVTDYRTYQQEQLEQQMDELNSF